MQKTQDYTCFKPAGTKQIISPVFFSLIFDSWSKRWVTIDGWRSFQAFLKRLCTSSSDISLNIFECRDTTVGWILFGGPDTWGSNGGQEGSPLGFQFAMIRIREIINGRKVLLWRRRAQVSEILNTLHAPQDVVVDFWTTYQFSAKFFRRVSTTRRLFRNISWLNNMSFLLLYSSHLASDKALKAITKIDQPIPGKLWPEMGKK
jgi:hypothetical protein